MARLTNQVREDIISNAIKASGHFERVAAAEARRYELAEEVRVYSLGGQDVAELIPPKDLPAAQLPAIPLDTINKLIGLPSCKK
jgi:hypothetical protein